MVVTTRCNSCVLGNSVVRTSELLTAALAAIACSCGSGEPAGAPTSQSSQAINSSPALPDFVLYAERSIALGIGSHSLGGDMGVASSAPGSGSAAQLIVGDLSGLDVFHNLIAPSIELGHLAVV